VEERWKQIVNYEGFYEVSDMGRVRGVDRTVKSKGRGKRFHPGKVLTPKMASSGYPLLSLYANGKKTSRNVHRLVIDTFNPDKVGGLECNHINGNKTDNRLQNLEWVTRSENKLHAFATGLQKPTADKLKKPVIRDDGAVFASVKEAGLAIGGHGPLVGMVCRGVRRTYKGYSFKYFLGGV